VRPWARAPRSGSRCPPPDTVTRGSRRLAIVAFRGEGRTMKSLTLLAVAAAAVALPAASAQAQTQAQNAGGQSTSSSAITRSLNQAPPSAMAPATPRDEDQVSTRPVAAPAIEPARTPAAQTPRAQAPQAQTTPAP